MAFYSGVAARALLGRWAEEHSFGCPVRRYTYSKCAPILLIRLHLQVTFFHRGQSRVSLNIHHSPKHPIQFSDQFYKTLIYISLAAATFPFHKRP